jgi:MFS family permease
MTLFPASPGAQPAWRTPAVIVICGCLIAILTFGPRSTLGFFLTPLSRAHGWGRDVFAFALAIQNLLWGAFQPFAGGVADRYGAVRVLWTGAIAYAAGLALMSQASSPCLLDLTAGVLIGFALSSCSFNLVIGALCKLVPE